VVFQIRKTLARLRHPLAEGQWRYVESLSTYARMSLDKIDRPDVDRLLRDVLSRADTIQPCPQRGMQRWWN
jgi:excinuclease UvrABC ATPase subunit